MGNTIAEGLRKQKLNEQFLNQLQKFEQEKELLSREEMFETS